MTFERSREVYVLFEGVFALAEPVDVSNSNWVTVCTQSGLRVELPIEAVAEWDVETALGPPVAPRLTAASLPPSASTHRQTSSTPARRLRHG